MGHFVRTAVEVIGVAVAIAAAIPSGGTSLLAAGLASAGVSVSAGVVVAATELAVAGIGILTAKKPTALANPMDWQSNPQAGIPHVMGRMFYGGQIVYRQTYEKDNKAERIHTVYSTGPIKGFEGFYVSGVLTSVTGETANINDRGKLLVGTQAGQQPEAVQFGGTDAPGITAASKLSGLAASSITLFYDSKGSQTFTTEPQCGYVVLGTPVYDPRKDSTYPGGNGPQRSNDETTWDYAGYDNPGLKALSYLIGYRQNGKLVIGVGLPIASIVVSQFVEMANVCDANGWKMGGVTLSTDKKWTVFTQILQAGGAVPLRTGTTTGCLVNTPKVSLATFEISDIIGDWSIQATQSRRDRINAVVPRYMAEQSLVGETTDSDGNTVLQTTVTWGMAAAGAIIVDDYVTFDGGQRQKEIEYPFVTGVSTGNNAPNQIAQLARYDIENAREFGPISLPMKPRWMGYRAGDVITGGASLTELGLVGQDIMLLQRQFSPGNMTVTFTARSETAAKHPFALGQTTTAPPTPSLTGPPLIPVPGNTAWALVGGTMTSASGTTKPVLMITGAVDSDVIDAVVFQYRTSQTDTAAPGPWKDAGSYTPTITLLDIATVEDETAYDVSVAYRKGIGTGTALILGPAIAGQTAVPWSSGVVGPGKPADNADVTSAVFVTAGRSVADVISDLDINAAGIVSQALRQDDAATALNAQTFVNGQPISTVLTTFTNQQTTTNSAVASSLALLGAKTPDGSAWSLNLDTVQVGAGQSLAEKFNEIGVTNGLISAKVQTLAEAYLDSDGNAKSIYMLSLTAVGSSGLKAIGGFTDLVSGDGTSDFAIIATTFKVVSVDGSTVTVPFQITAGGVTQMPDVEVGKFMAQSITTDAILPGAITNTSRLVSSSSFTGNGAWQQVAAISITLDAPATFKLTFNCGQGYADGKKDWGLRLKVDGTVIKSYNYGGDRVALTDVLTIIRGNVALAANATHTLSAEWAADDSTVTIDQIDFLAEWSFV